jgi:rhodanese-related sulfurtransferase
MNWKLTIVPAMLLALCLAATAAQAKDFNFISPGALKMKMDKGEPMHLMDIQVEDEYAAHHLRGAVKTCAYPVKSAEEKAKLDQFIATAKKDDLPVVVICPRGGGGAERAYRHLKESGIAEDRLLILEKGQQGWPYKDMLEK